MLPTGLTHHCWWRARIKIDLEKKRNVSFSQLLFIPARLNRWIWVVSIPASCTQWSQTFVLVSIQNEQPFHSLLLVFSKLHWVWFTFEYSEPFYFISKLGLFSPESHLVVFENAGEGKRNLVLQQIIGAPHCLPFAPVRIGNSGPVSSFQLLYNQCEDLFAYIGDRVL